jgi:hypothetical protein
VPGLEVVGSRFVLQGHRILDSRDEARVVEELRLICHHTKYNVTVFHPYFIYFDQVSILCKKSLSVFHSPAGMSLTKLSLAGKNLIIPSQGKFGQ